MPPARVAPVSPVEVLAKDLTGREYVYCWVHALPWPTSHFSPVCWEQKLKAGVGRLMLLPGSGVAGPLFHPLPLLGFPSAVPSLSPLHQGRCLRGSAPR